MKIPMGPPPPKNPDPNPPLPPFGIPTQTPVVEVEEDAPTMKVPMGPPPPKNPNPEPNPDPPQPPTPTPTPTQTPEDSDSTPNSHEPIQDSNSAPNSNPNPNPTPCRRVDVPYSIPTWSQAPTKPFSFEVLKDGAIVEQLDVSQKGAYMFGRVDLCDFILEHPTISRFHAVLQFKQDDEAFLYDIGSTHGTFVNKNEVKKKEYTKLNVGDVVRFGLSSRLYILQGPSELMPPEGDLEKLRIAKALREEMLDREASLARARVEASLADGISWGMSEDAIEESIEDGAEEVTWQTFKGQLTERQEKTRGKILKRLEKVTNMKKEIDAIRAKDISQGGLTQGQQTQIARNEQRTVQILEELESLEETLNESIQESLGARAGKVSRNKKKGSFEEEDDDMSSDDDDFYDRTKKKKSSVKKSGEQQVVETADSLLNKKETIVNEMEEKKALLQKEREKLVSTEGSSADGGDDLDAFMTGLSSQLVIDKTTKIEKELSDLQSELNRVLYLLKIADPTGDAARKRDAKAQAPRPKQPVIDTRNQPQPKQKKPVKVEKPTSSSPLVGSSSTKEMQDEEKKKKPPVYSVAKPQWLGDAKNMKFEEDHAEEAPIEVSEADEFVDYKDRKNVLASGNTEPKLEHAAPGLILRKRKPTENPEETVDNKAQKVTEAETTAADAVALLLKHKRGYVALEDELGNETQKSKPKRVLGPSKPDFLDRGPDYEAWVPPEGQTGDGRTSLNDRLGY